MQNKILWSIFVEKFFLRIKISKEGPNFQNATVVLPLNNAGVVLLVNKIEKNWKAFSDPLAEFRTNGPWEKWSPGEMVPEKWSSGKMVPGKMAQRKMVLGKNGPRKIGPENWKIVGWAASIVVCVCVWNVGMWSIYENLKLDNYPFWTPLVFYSFVHM